MRKFGIEIELNSFDQRDFKKFPLSKNEYPSGIDYVESLIKNLDLSSKVMDWHQTHNNKDWICKPDSSCGIEICSPVLDNFDSLIKVINILSQDSNIKVDKRCSFHVHFDIEDCIGKKGYKIDFNAEKFISILSWWIKCEPVFFDSAPDHRKNNKYCQCIGISDIFKSEDSVEYSKLLRLGNSKYYSCNIFHLYKGFRPTIEFRLGDESFCLDSDFARNWILLLSHFIDCAIRNGVPNSYCWIDLEEVFDFLGFNKTNLDEDKAQVRKWFLMRILKNLKSNLTNWNANLRIATQIQIKKISKDLQLDKDFDTLLSLYE